MEKEIGGKAMYFPPTFCCSQMKDEDENGMDHANFKSFKKWFYP